jgi:hypothetical protein
MLLLELFCYMPGASSAQKSEGEKGDPAPTQPKHTFH